MTVLNREDWYDIARDVEWTLSYVKDEDAFPAVYGMLDAIAEAGEHALRELHARAGLDAGRPSGEHR